MRITVVFDIMNSSDWWDENLSIESETIEEARYQAIQMANGHELAHNIQIIHLLLPDGEQHYCYSGNMNRTTFCKVMPPDFGKWIILPADTPKE